jgi:TonB family protein
MSNVNSWNEPFFPWVESENDRRFKRILRNSIIISMVLGIIVGFLPRPEIEQKELKDVSPRLAKLIIKKKKLPPPPPPKVTKKKKIEKKTKKAEKKKPKTKKQKSARKKAEKSGILALSDQLADLRDFDMSSLGSSSTLQKSGKSQSKKTNNTSAVISAKAKAGSGGIRTRPAGSTGGGDLAGIASSNVKSSIPSGDGAGTTGAGGRSRGRSESEVQLVFQKNAAAIDSLYNRALRKDPSLQGIVLIQLTIAPSGKVIDVKIIDSELGDKKLERRLIARIKLFRFPKKNVATVTFKYPINFLPS